MGEKSKAQELQDLAKKFKKALPKEVDTKTWSDEKLLDELNKLSEELITTTDEVLDLQDKTSVTLGKVNQAMMEFRQSWFMVLAVFLLRNNLEVTLTTEELEKAKKLQITKFEDPEGKWVRFTAVEVEVPDAGSKS